MALTLVASLSLVIWLYLAALRGGFWRADARLEEDTPAPPEWPHVVAIVPARDEAGVIARAIASLLAQDYPGKVDIVLADDHSGDGTADRARGPTTPSAHSATAGAVQSTL